MDINNIVLVIGAYLLGSFSSAVVVCKLFGVADPRTQGSGNPGATNVLRNGGKKLAAITLFLDVIKGLLPILIAKLFTNSPMTLSLVVLAAFLGHLYPVFFGFRGGKGVATALGSLSGVVWQVGIAMIMTWLIIAAIFRYSSLAALTASLFAPIYMFYFTDDSLQTAWIYTFITLSIAILLFWRHHSNIKNLLNGQESKIGHKK
jgi:glycerol-3-phosphate acyltransferase PlsY